MNGRPVVPGSENRSAGGRSRDQTTPLLQIGLRENAYGCVVQLTGDLIGDTSAGLFSIEPMLANEARVALDLSGVTSIDGAGLEATVRLIDAIHTFGGRLTIGCQHPSTTALEGSSI